MNAKFHRHYISVWSIVDLLKAKHMSIFKSYLCQKDKSGVSKIAVGVNIIPSQSIPQSF